MSVSGLCEVCESREVVDGCDRCGRLVCGRHFDEDHGLCTECAAELERARGDTSGDGDRGKENDYPDGVGEYRF